MFTHSQSRKSLALFTTLLLIPLTYLIPHASAQDAQSTAPHDIAIPEVLKPWVTWIEDGHPEWQCAWDSKKYHCIWPGEFRYELRPQGASFELNVVMQKAGSVPLPATTSMRPQTIQVENDSGLIVAPLSISGSLLTVRLPAGEFRIRGTFLWEKLPPELPLPESYGIWQVGTSRLGQNLQVERRKDKVWISKKDKNQGSEQAKLTVMRKIIDGSPVQVQTILKLRVSGASRPLDLGQVLPQGSVPIAISSTLPHFLSPDGNLALQITPGEYKVMILAVLPQPVHKLSLPKSPSELWPPEETWSFVSDNVLRSVEVIGAKAVHREATELPPDWKEGATYLVTSSSQVTLKELRRGLAKLSPNALNLQREFWVDLYDRGLTVRDTFTGSLSKDARLNTLPSTILGRATVKQQPTLITKDPTNNLWGIEMRENDVQLQAISRYENTKTFSAVGWNTQVEQLGGLLHLPPSWKLITIIGANSVQGSWLSSWTLLQVFLSFLIVLASRKLFSLTIATLVAACLVLNHGEYLAPQMLFVHLLLLVVWRSILSDKESIWYASCRVLLYTTFLALVIESLAFSKLQFTQLLFPQLQAGTRHRSLMQQLYMGIELTPLVWPAIMFYAGLAIAWALSMIHATGIKKRILKTLTFGLLGVLALPLITIIAAYQISSPYTTRPQYFGQRAQTAFSPLEQSYKVQSKVSDLAAKSRSSGTGVQAVEEKALTSGPALPTWHWRTHHFAVDSPVGPAHQLRIITLSPTIVRIICGLRTVLILGLVWLLWSRIWTEPLDLISALTRSARPALILGAISLALPLSVARADIPGSTLLVELEERLRRDHCKRDHCAEIEQASFLFSDSDFSIQLHVISDGSGVVTLPGPLKVLPLEQVSREGQKFLALRANEQGFLQISTPPGRTIFEITGPLLSLSAFSIEFPQKPLTASVAAPTWFVEGLRQSGSIPDTLRLTRRKGQAEDVSEASKAASEVKLATWVRTTRMLRIAESATLRTTVNRMGDRRASARITIPLLAEESVTSGDVKATASGVEVTFLPGVESVSYTSALPVKDKTWDLRASDTPGISEYWTLRCSSSIHCSTSGLNPNKVSEGGRMAWHWQPFPGEEVSIKAQELSAVQGEFLTIDTLRHALQWGTRLLKGEVLLSVRVTQQSTLNIDLAQSADIQQVSVDKVEGSAITSGPTTSVLLNPGEHQVALKYQQAFAPGILEKAPKLSLSAPSHNVHIELKPANNRWLLWTGGPAWGPCVVYWAKLIVIVVFCLALYRLSLSPLTLTGSILIGIGLSSLPVILLWLPLLWLATLECIPKNRALVQRIPRLLRLSSFIALSVIALVLLYQIVRTGLVLQPPMLIVGNNSNYNLLKWYVDHNAGEIAQPWVISLPMSYWRAFSLAWAMWLVLALFSLLKRSVTTVKEELYPS